MRKHIGTICLGLGALIAIAILTVPEVRRVFTGRSVGNSSYVYTTREMRTRLDRIEHMLPAFEQDLAAQRYEEAKNRYIEAKEDLVVSLKMNGDVRVDEQTMLSDGLAKVDLAATNLVRGEFARQVQKLEQGEPDTLIVRRLIATFPQIGRFPLTGEFEARLPAAELLRRRFATRWIRVQADIPDEGFRTLIEGLMRPRYLPAPGLTYVFCPPLGPAEAEATFASVRIESKLGFNSYGWKKEIEHEKEVIRTGKGLIIQHPESLGGLINRMSLVVEVKRIYGDYAVRWSSRPVRLEKQFDLPTPAELDPGFKSPAQAFLKLNEPRIEDLKGRVTSILKELPDFDWLDTTDRQLPLSRRAALQDPAAFLAAASAALAQNQSVGSLANIGAELLLEPLGDQIEARLDQLTAADRRQLSKTLAIVPWYHDYRIVRALIPRADDHELAIMFEGLKSDLGRPELRAAARERILQRREPAQSSGAPPHLLLTLIKYSPDSSVSEYATLYPAASPATRGEIVNGIIQFHRIVAGEFLHRLAENQSPAEALAFIDELNAALEHFHFKDWKLTADEIRYYQRIIERAPSPVRVKMLEKLPDVGDLLLRLLRADRTSWDGPETLVLIDRVAPKRFPGVGPDLEAAMALELFTGLKLKLLNTPELFRATTSTIGWITNDLSKWPGYEPIKVGVTLEIIDMRDPDPRFYATSIRQIMGRIDPAAFVKVKDARLLLRKGLGHPDPEISRRFQQLAADSAKIDPAFARP